MGYILSGLLAGFAAVILWRTLTFRPKAQPALSEETYDFDKDAAVSALQQLVRCKTVSYSDPTMEDDHEFRKLIDLILTVV